MADRHAAPKHDEFEVSLFGPGVGECVVLHTGLNEWIVVDSCLDTAVTGTENEPPPVAVTYLEGLGVAVDQAIRWVIVTHWHDDHHAGIARLLELAEKASFGCSAALKTEEFLAFRFSISGVRAHGSGDVSEMSAVLDKLIERQSDVHKASRGPDCWLSADRPVFTRSSQGGVPELSLTALSPSDAMMTRAKHEIGSMIAEPGTSRRRVAANRANDISVALWLRCGDVDVLLGSDLERKPNNKRIGWHGVINDQNRPQGKAFALKVPHHGSETGDEPEIWSEMMQDEPLVMLTPYRPSGLPKDTDIARLLSRTPDVYLTAPVRTPRPPRRSNAVEKMAALTAVERRLRRHPRVGQVRLRWRGDDLDSLRVDLFEGAAKLPKP